jgi:hypothetical protein
VPWWLRAYLILGAIQGIGLGITGFVLPEGIQIPYQMSPLNARFIGALYLAAGIGVLLSAFARRRDDTRIFVIGFGVATGLILIVTILHWPEFMADPLPHRASWIGSYVLDPLLALLIVLAAGLLPLPSARSHRFSVLLNVECVILGLLGALLLFLPETAAAVWPWTLPPVLGQLYGCFFLALSLGAFLAAREPSAAAVRTYLVTSLALTLLVLLASALHLPRFKPELVSWLWFGAFSVGAVAFAVALVMQARGPEVGRPLAQAETLQE